MDGPLAGRTPSAASRRRAESEGVALEPLEDDASLAHMVVNAGEVLRAAPELVALAGGMVLAAFPEHRVFRAPAGTHERVLAFPALSRAQLKRLDGLLAPLVERPEWRARHAYYRQVADVHGVTRELALALAPAGYRDGDGIVGPFADESSAERWGRVHVRAPRVHDCFAMNGHWYCDVFRADPMGDPASVDTRGS